MTVQFPDSLWVDTATPLAPNPALEGDSSCDVVVIGAGFTGLRAALHLSEAGSRVIVLDAGDVGWGASGRNGGQVNPMLPFNTPDKLMQLVGPQYFDRLTETSLDSADALFALSINTGSTVRPVKRDGCALTTVNRNEKYRRAILKSGIVMVRICRWSKATKSRA